MTLTLERSTASPNAADTTRRGFFVFGAALASIVAGCGRDSTGSSTTLPARGTRTVDDHFGPVQVPFDPQRVVLFGTDPLANAVRLGFPPQLIAGYSFGASVDYGPYRHLDVDLTPITNVGDFWEPDTEQVIALDPDLIINFVDERDDLLTRHHAATATYGQFDVPVFAAYSPVNITRIEEPLAQFRDIARALGREERAAEIETALTDRVASTRERFQADIPPTVQVLNVLPDSRLFSSHALVLDVLGVPGDRPDSTEQYRELSPERLDEMNADVLFVALGAGISRSTAESQALWDQLPAVRSGRVVYVSSDVWGDRPNVAIIEIVLSDIEAALIG